MKTTKLFWTLAASVAAFAMSVVFASCEKKDPAPTPGEGEEEEEEEVKEDQPLGIAEPGAGKTTLVVYIPNSACSDAVPYVLGSLPGDGNWANVEELKMTRCEGKQEWWQVTVEALNPENAPNFKFRMDAMGNANAWVYEPKEPYILLDDAASYLEIKADETKNLVTIADCDNKVLYIDCPDWSTPCKETNKAGKATIVATLPEVPAGYTVGVVGNFAAEGVGYWDIVSGVQAMTLGADGKYTLETEVPAGFEFKILLSEDGTTWSWDLGQAADANFAMGLDLKADVTVEAWKGL